MQRSFRISIYSNLVANSDYFLIFHSVGNFVVVAADIVAADIVAVCCCCLLLLFVVAVVAAICHQGKVIYPSAKGKRCHLSGQIVRLTAAG